MFPAYVCTFLCTCVRACMLVCCGCHCTCESWECHPPPLETRSLIGLQLTDRHTGWRILLSPTPHPSHPTLIPVPASQALATTPGSFHWLWEQNSDPHNRKASTTVRLLAGLFSGSELQEGLLASYACVLSVCVLRVWKQEDL